AATPLRHVPGGLGGSAMNPLTRLVALREIREALRNKGIWVTFAALLLGGLAIVILPEVLPDGHTERDLVTVGELPTEVTDELVAAGASVELTWTIEPADSPATARELVKDGSAD